MNGNDGHHTRYQRWTIELDAVAGTYDGAFDAWIENSIQASTLMRDLIELAGVNAVMEYADPE